MLTIPSKWIPPFCPRPNCKFHKGPTYNWPYKKIGFAYRLHPPKRNQRFLCLHCHRSFSRQTFSTTYWLKKPWALVEIFRLAVTCAANRQIGRALKLAPDTVDRQMARLGRHCLLFHLDRWQQAAPQGPLVIDGFESFEYSQYHPFHHNLAVEADTGFFCYFTDSELRRKGRMTRYQKRRRSELEACLGRPSPREIRRGMRELLSVSLANASSAVVRSDDHRAYPPAIAEVACQIQHEVTSSQERRDAKNPLFEINRLDNWIRHCSSNHKRETIAWSKRRQASAERLAILLVDRNYRKPARVKSRSSPTAAMLKGIEKKRLRAIDVLRKRLFPSLITLPARWRAYYERKVRTRSLQVNRCHELTYAF